MTEPVWVMWLETMAGTTGPMVAGGCELLPGSVLQSSPQVTVGSSTKPLNAAGAEPLLRALSFHHWAPQNVTWLPTAAFWSPITNGPVLEGGSAIAPPTRTSEAAAAAAPAAAS